MFHDGVIAEQGTYLELMEQDGAFAQLVREFSNENQDFQTPEKCSANKAINWDNMTANVYKTAKLKQVETMNTGGMKASIYNTYLKAGNGITTLPLLALSVLSSQAITLLTSFWLVWWQEKKFTAMSNTLYEGIYVALGIGSALLLFAVGASISVMSYFASVNLYQQATMHLLKAPMSFYDGNPMGRLLNRMAKDRCVI